MCLSLTRVIGLRFVRFGIMHDINLLTRWDLYTFHTLGPVLGFHHSPTFPTFNLLV